MKYDIYNITYFTGPVQLLPAITVHARAPDDFISTYFPEESTPMQVTITNSRSPWPRGGRVGCGGFSFLEGLNPTSRVAALQQTEH